MTHRNDAARDADVLRRWRMLAEQRLEYLTQLFESGRWRRYYGEIAFLENIREAKVAVETWRGLSTTRAAADGPVLRVTWPAPSWPIEPAVVVQADGVPSDGDIFALEQGLDNAEPAHDLAAIQRRYPLLRNTF
jgi:uncharacterized repeat protein (TIGR03809 family)